jgi:phosphatidylglycerol---prolipoprotein diacylglyceryl transferase
MYPTLLRIGNLEVTSFGVLVAVAAIVGLAVFRRELRASRLPLAATGAGAIGVIGGLIGAKFLWVIEHAGEAAMSDLLLSRGGLSWYGGLIGGLGAGLGFIAIRRWPVAPTLAAAAPALAFGQMIGRIGCFLVGDDYGRPSKLPWAVAFPEGLPPTTVPVHPTQLYEALGLSLLGYLLLRWRHRGVSDAGILGRYLVSAGLLRFLIEFLRVNEPLAFGVSVARIVSMVAIALGVMLLAAPGGTR